MPREAGAARSDASRSHDDSVPSADAVSSPVDVDDAPSHRTPAPRSNAAAASASASAAPLGRRSARAGASEGAPRRPLADPAEVLRPRGASTRRASRPVSAGARPPSDAATAPHVNPPVQLPSAPQPSWLEGPLEPPCGRTFDYLVRSRELTDTFPFDISNYPKHIIGRAKALWRRALLEY